MHVIGVVHYTRKWDGLPHVLIHRQQLVARFILNSTEQCRPLRRWAVAIMLLASLVAPTKVDEKPPPSPTPHPKLPLPLLSTVDRCCRLPDVSLASSILTLSLYSSPKKFFFFLLPPLPYSIPLSQNRNHERQHRRDQALPGPEARNVSTPPSLTATLDIGKNLVRAMCLPIEFAIHGSDDQSWHAC